MTRTAIEVSDVVNALVTVNGVSIVVPPVANR
jgi:hypothetical protein